MKKTRRDFNKYNRSIEENMDSIRPYVSGSSYVSLYSRRARLLRLNQALPDNQLFKFIYKHYLLGTINFSVAKFFIKHGNKLKKTTDLFTIGKSKEIKLTTKQKLQIITLENIMLTELMLQTKNIKTIEELNKFRKAIYNVV